MPITDKEASDLVILETAFERAGGRGVELAEEIDALRAKRDTNGACILTDENIDTEDDCTTHDHETVSDAEVLDRIAWLLSAEEWPGACGLEDIAELVALTGRDLNQPDTEWPSH